MNVRRVGVVAVVVVCIVVGAVTFPSWWCGRGADAYFDGKLPMQNPLARSVAERVTAGVTPATFNTGSPRFDGEWAFITHAMGVVGMGQVVLAHPEMGTYYLPIMSSAVASMISPELLAFGESAWGESPLDALDGAGGHAYLGYLGLALGVLRLVDPDNPHADLHDRLSAALARRVLAASDGIIETYPGEVYPADISTVIGTVGLHARATGDDEAARDVVAAWATIMEPRFTEPSSGLLIQSFSPDGSPIDAGRASGTAMAAFALSFADREASARLFSAVRTAGRMTVLGFGAIREYPREAPGRGDIDSGPVFFGAGVSATGFTLAGARVHGDRELFRDLVRTMHLFGVPVERDGRRHHLTGGPIGDAVLLAVLTAGPAAAPLAGAVP